MAITRGYECDGPDCKVLTDKTPNTQGPESWLKLTVQEPGGKPRKGFFHRPLCGLRWLHVQTNPDAQEGDAEAAIDPGLDPSDEVPIKPGDDV